ncbi:hypothetical protein AYO20_09751 [Fonsecaea nubica]|uniref:Uncharacterized protein n=1 Tax=Fonsecaea nubica TaxID=856822 RepID=A0A178CBY6_9EURO|nr:hypothetical protein AYO20_09751 [Fonsecaea nubica]OAL27468.1 hypothetical protein AYO20_09751 [Fonsecaea nubica]
MTDMSEHNRSKTFRDEVAPSSPPADTTSHPFDLRYPEIPLHLSLDSLLEHSSSSSSNSIRTIGTMPPPEPDQSSLDDSWASLADAESSNEDDLQSEHTDVGSLLDVHSSDDIQSVSDEVPIHDDALSDGDGLEDTLTEDLSPQPIMNSPPEREYVWHQRPPFLPSAVFSKQDMDQDVKGPIDTFTTIRPLSEGEARRLPHGGQGDGEMPRYVSVIRMPILESGLDLDVHNYFKVLLLGHHVEQFKPELERKLGDVLVSRPMASHNVSPTSVSRYHLVPNTFGPGAEPDFADLVAIDKLIDFECYDLVQLSGGLGQQEQLTLRNSQTRSEIVSMWSGSRFLVDNPRWTLPDLAIICVHLDDAGNMNSSSCNMISFVERQGIPKVLIRMDRGLEGDYRGCVTSDSLHECIEAIPLRSWSVQHKVSPQLPLDMAAFLNLDAAALNKHIAYVVLSAERARVSEIDGWNSLSKEPNEKSPTKTSLLPQVSASFIKNVFIVLWIVGVYSFLGLRLWPILSDPTSGAISGDIVASVTAKEHPPSAGRELSMSTSATSADSSKVENQAAQQLLDIASLNVVPAVADDALHFQVGVGGEGQLLVKLPKVALSRKKRSPLSIELKRKNQTVPATVQELFEGVFRVQLQPYDAHGDIEVNLTIRKPQISELITVSFGPQPASEYQHLKALFGMLSGRAQEMASSFVDSWKGVREGQVMDGISSFPKLASAGSQGQKLLNRAWHFLNMSALADFQSWLRTETHILHGDVVRMTQHYAVPGKRFSDMLSDRLSNARLALFEMAEAVDIQRFSPPVGKKAILRQLAAAQERAKQIVTKAARKVRASKARA